MRIYLDSAAVIYTVEQVAPYAEMVDSRLSGPDVVIVTSDLTRLECRVKPLRDDKTDSLHLAAAVWSRCEVFLTNDHRLDRFREVSIEVILP